MILALRTDSPETYLAVLDSQHKVKVEQTWLSERRLAEELLGRLAAIVEQAGGSFQDLTGIIVYLGPGSFTGLRIGITTANALADGLSLPLAGGTGDDWIKQALHKLVTEPQSLPLVPSYGAEANITPLGRGRQKNEHSG